MLEFAGLANTAFKTWSEPAAYPPSARFPYISLSDSELLLSAHYMPIAIAFPDGAPCVVALADPALSRQSAFDENGHWRAGYKPMALRCLPFRLAATLTGDPLHDLEIAVGWPETPGPMLKPLRDSNGLASKELHVVSDLLKRQHEGAVRLARASDRLLLADLLKPITASSDNINSTGSGSLYTVDGERLKTTKSAQLAAMARQDFLAIDLLSACIFSQRLLTKTARDKTEQKTDSIQTATLEQFSGQFTVMLDESELFGGF
jgi:SapC